MWAISIGVVKRDLLFTSNGKLRSAAQLGTSQLTFFELGEGCVVGLAHLHGRYLVCTTGNCLVKGPGFLAYTHCKCVILRYFVVQSYMFLT
jgi:hypothetical protein